MNDYFNCPKCGYAPRPSDPRAREQGVCSDCWTEYYMKDWYELQDKGFTHLRLVSLSSGIRLSVLAYDSTIASSTSLIN